MEKVKVTREQAEAIEFAKKNHPNIDIVKAYVNYRDWRLCGELDSLKLLEFDDLIKALYNGYEVEPEFKVGDWVVIDYKEHGTKVGKIKGYIKKDAFYIDNNHAAGSIMNTRHATPEEIVAEKERRWWAKHGRDVWELREGDILFDALYSVFQEVLRINGTEITWFDGDKASMDYVKERCKVVCFAENRLDGDFGEGDKV